MSKASSLSELDDNDYIAIIVILMCLWNNNVNISIIIMS